MADFPSQPPLPLFLSTWSRYTAANELWAIQGSVSAPTSATWPVANQAFFIPVSIPWPYPVRRVFWVNGSSTTTTNMDFGIYSASGTRIYSTGSTAEGTVSVPQYVTPTEFLLTPGRYYFALACSSTTSNRGGQGSAPVLARIGMTGVLLQTSALALPATMTGAALSGTPHYPLCGITRTASGF